MADLAPFDEEITLQQLDENPYPIYQKLRRETPVLRVKATGRTLLTKAEDTKYVKDNPGCSAPMTLTHRWNGRFRHTH